MISINIYGRKRKQGGTELWDGKGRGGEGDRVAISVGRKRLIDLTFAVITILFVPVLALAVI